LNSPLNHAAYQDGLETTLTKHERGEQLNAAGRKREAKRLWNRTPSILYRFISAAQAEKINRITIERATRWIYSPVEKSETPTLFRGEPRNLRVEMREIDQIGTLQTSFRIDEPHPAGTGPD
jgi:hypothetical protein